MNPELKKLTASIQKKYGDSVVELASQSTRTNIVTYTTGSLMLDLACGGGDRAGIPEGRIMEVYGPESQGKTTMTLLMIAARQQHENQMAAENPDYEKKYCIFLDAEHALDFQLAEEYGVDLTELIYIDPETAEPAFDILDAYIRTGSIALIVVDSVPALLVNSIEQSSYEQQHMGTLARFMSGAMQRIAGPLFANKTTMVFINQIREKIGGYSPTGIQSILGFLQ